jgi:hypothetical protein
MDPQKDFVLSSYSYKKVLLQRLTSQTVIMSSAVEEEAKANPGCGVLGRHPIIAVVSFAAAGCALGVGLSYWNPEDPEDKNITLQWLGLIGTYCTMTRPFPFATSYL